jgi:hypothetical protein
MPIATSLIRQYVTQQDYEQDTEKLANLAYIVIAVVEQPNASGWAQRLRKRVFGSVQPRLIVSYRDQGIAL